MFWKFGCNELNIVKTDNVESCPIYLEISFQDQSHEIQILETEHQNI